MKVKKYFRNQLEGPETIIQEGNYFYCTAKDGVYCFNYHDRRLIKVISLPDLVSPLPDNYPFLRPLGCISSFNRDELLIAVLNVGLIRYDLIKGKKELIFHSPFLNSLAREGNNIYVTESFYHPDYFRSEEQFNQFSRKQFLLGIASGSIYHLRKTSKDEWKINKLLSDLPFPNGITVINDQLIFSCTSSREIRTYDLRSQKMKVLLDSLPGYPDNVTRFGKHFWVSLYSPAPWEPLERLIRFLVQKSRFLLQNINFPELNYTNLLKYNLEGRLIERIYDRQIENQTTSVLETEEALFLGSLNRKSIVVLQK